MELYATMGHLAVTKKVSGNFQLLADVFTDILRLAETWEWVMQPVVSRNFPLFLYATLCTRYSSARRAQSSLKSYAIFPRARRSQCLD